jgi:hypothetical protein
MACCSAEGPCPMHESESRSDGSTRVVSQAEADRCCTLSKRDDSTPSPSNVALSIAQAVWVSPVPALIPAPKAHSEFWRALVPLPTARVPKHLLLSVLVV